MSHLINKPSKELIDLASSVFLAKAWEATVRPIVEKIQNDLLLKGQYVNQFYREDNTEKIITNNEHAYLMAEDDFTAYYKLCHDEYLKAGFTIEEYGQCPLLMAEELTRQAVRAMLTEAKKITGLDPEEVLCSANALKNYAHYTELTLQLCEPFVNHAEILKEIEPKKKNLNHECNK